NAKQLGATDSSALACANLQMDALTGHVNVGGDIMVEAFAQQGGTSYASANAWANIQANTDININGNVEVTASANNLGSDVTGAFACANLQLDALTGNVTVNHDINVSAFARSSGIGGAAANAEANILAVNNIDTGGNLAVTAAANELNHSGSGANALANLQVD